MLDSTALALYRRLAREQSAGRAPSLVAAVVRDGELVWSGARGRVGDARPGPDTQYRLGSITKTMIATLVMRLRDEGRLALTDPVERHLPGTAFGSATIAQLLSHTSGLTSESPGVWWERAPGADWAALVASLGEDATKLRPGFKFHYSNVGFGVLGELVARHRGRPWFDVVRDEILIPLGMHRTTPHPEGAHAEGFAVHPFADVLLPEPSPDAGAMAPAGQLWSTITDLGRWTAFLGGYTGGVLSGDTLAEMRTMNTVDDTEVWTTGFGLGLMVVRHQGRHLAGHTGSMPGFLAATLIDPASGTGALCLANATAGVGVTTLCLDLIEIVGKREPAVPAEWRPSTVDPDLLALTGLWHWGPTPYLLRVQGDGRLTLNPADGAGRASRFHPLGEDRWLGLDGYYAGETLIVGRDATGTATHLNLATFIFSRTPYDPAAPIPGGVHEAGWH